MFFAPCAMTTMSPCYARPVFVHQPHRPSCCPFSWAPRVLLFALIFPCFASAIVFLAKIALVIIATSIASCGAACGIDSIHRAAQGGSWPCCFSRERNSKCTRRGGNPGSAREASCQTPQCAPNEENVKTASLPRPPVSNVHGPSAPSSSAVEVGQVLSMSEHDDAYKLTITVPGIKQSDLHVSADAGYLKVEGKLSLGATTHKIDRLFQFPMDAHLDLATAVHSDGVLSFTIPKVAKPKPQKIGITTAKESTDAVSKAEPLKHKAGLCRAANANPVLTECDADEANVQAHEESVDDVEVAEERDENTPRAMPTPTRSSQADDARTTVKEEKADAVKGTEAAQEGGSSEDASDWDELLGDLEEMGFEDRQSNKAALEKHAGSVKLAVKELVMSRIE